MTQHRSLTGADIHVAYAWTYADATARGAATGFSSTDVGKLALQQSDNSLWLLTAATTPTWKAVGVIPTLGQVGGVVLTSPTNGQVLTYNGTNWINQASSVNTSVKPVGVRQTVLAGGVDVNGLANFLTGSGSALSVSLAATATPVHITFANGFASGASADYGAVVASDVSNAWTSLTASTTNYLYVDYNSSNGALTYGFSTLQPLYQLTAPSSPATDQHWFDLTQFVMKRWSGTTWAQVWRVFVGEAVTGTSAVTSTVTYGLRGRCFKLISPVATNTAYTISHNLGIQDVKTRYVIIDTANGNHRVSGEFNSWYDTLGRGFQLVQADRNTSGIDSYNQSYVAVYGYNGSFYSPTTGNMEIYLERPW